MISTGIIAEYNPLHNGHEYHLQQAKELTHSDVMVVAMSGNWVQRGEPAIVDKWERASAAIKAGADLVLEIPCLWSLSDAGHFAKAGVGILESLGTCKYLAFGSECGDVELLRKVRNNMACNEDAINNLIRNFSKEGNSFPKARELSYYNLFGKSNSINNEIGILSSSNDILALEYLMASNELEPVPIKRLGARYDDKLDMSQLYQSASGIRDAIMRKEDISKYVPDFCNYEYNTNYSEKLYDAVRLMIINLDSDQIEKCPAGGEGIANKLKIAAINSNNLEELINNTKSKRYTYTRISRLIMQLLLGINNEKYSYDNVPYLRILALNENGRKYVSYLNKNELNTIPFITNINKGHAELDDYGRDILELEIKSTNIYNLINNRNMRNYSEYTCKPVII